MSCRIYMVNKLAVEIIERHTHTFLVRFIKTGKISSVGKKYVKSFIPKKKPQKIINNNQTKFNF